MKIRYLFVLLLTVLSCNKQTPTEPDRPDNPDYGNLLEGVQFEPDFGPPGTIVKMSNLVLPTGEDTAWSFEIGGQIVPVLRDSGTTIHTVIPLIFKDSGSTWPTVPSAPVNVTLLRFDKAVDSVIGVITIDSLPHAEGAADSLLSYLKSGAEAIRSLALSIGIQDTVMLAVYDALDEILYTGENSLENILNGNSPLVPGDSMHKKIFSALLASSGYLDFFSNWADSLNSVAVTAKLLRTQISLSGITDEGLAARMQLQSFINDFGTIVVGNTAATWSKISAVIGAAGIAFPALGYFEFIVSYIVGELDFVINKLVVAAFPSEITRMDLDFMNHQISVGDTTEAIVYVSAKNNPPNITPMDIVSQVVNGMALVDWIRNIGIPRRLIQRWGNFEQIIQDLTVWFLGVINNILSANYNYPTQLDISFPHWTWDSVLVTNPELIDLISPDLSKIGYISGSFNGQAKDSLGKIGLQMRTQPPGPHTWIHPVLQSLGYVGGAFGNNLYISNVDTITVVGELALEVDFANTITVGGANVLGLNAGYLDRNGYPHWDSNIQINLTVTDGTASTTSGVTDAQGHFSSIIQIDSTADSVTVHIFAYGEYNSQTDTVVVAYSDANPSDTLGSGWGIRCVTDQGDNRSWAQAVGDYTFQNGLVTAAHDEFNLLYANNDCGIEFSATPGKYMGAQTIWGTASVLSEARLSVVSQSNDPDYYQGFHTTGNCSASSNWSIPGDSVGYAENSNVSCSSSTGTYVNLYVDSGYYVLVYEGELTADNSYQTLNSETYFSINATEIVYQLDVSTNSVIFSDSLLLSPGNYYSIKIQTYAEGRRNDQSVSGSASGTSSYVLNCRIHRAPIQ